MKHAQDELVWVDTNGVVHPLGESAGEQMKRRKDGAFRLLPTPNHVIFMRFTGQDGRRDEEDGAVVRLAGEIVAPGAICDVLALVAQAGWRGELTVRDGEHNRSVFIEGGNAVSATTDVEDERIGRILYRFGVIDEVAHRAIYERQAQGSGERFGEDYLPEKPRQFKTKTKNAQEAHEAIRPTDLFRAPADLRGQLDDDQRRLYELIWKRTVASQMAAALLDRVVVDVSSADGAVSLRATGQTIAFDGFLKLYQEGRDDPSGDEDEDGAMLPPLNVNDPLRQREVTPLQHFTEPPPRFSEASLVKKMEELGIGRPSTYASIISVLQSRSYVRLEQKRFVPEDKGWLVNAFLVEKFGHWVEYGFTAQLEDQLDEVAGGGLFWKDVLRQFWGPFAAKLAEVGEQRQREIIDALDHALGPLLFTANGEGETDPRLCPRCQEGRLGLKLSGFGPFVGCSRYPECNYTRAFTIGGAGGEVEPARADRLLGVDPDLAEEVWLKIGRFGPYLQRGTGAEAKRGSLPPSVTPDSVDLETALQLLALPREVGLDPETQKPIMAGINRYGPYVQLEKKFVRLEPGDDVLTVGMNRAVALLNEPAKGRRATAPATPLRELGNHPADDQPIQLLPGRFGPYVKHGKLNASLPRGASPETLTLDQAVQLLADRAAKGGGKPARAGRGKTAAAAKKAAPAKPAKKAPAAGKTAASATRRAKAEAPKAAARKQS